MLKVLARRLGWIMAAVACGTALGQGTSPESKGVAERRAQATALRNSFVKAIVAAGMSCPIAPPKIVVRDVPSYGSYEGRRRVQGRAKRPRRCPEGVDARSRLPNRCNLITSIGATRAGTYVLVSRPAFFIQS